ncbi:hypothetical protein CEE36_06465 [candidate division TA06 bacterium B3_TA06]|uniref:DUF91 domain-containing protein n=1 Tax=candidate division TA06 bacterium B3_TA06 TaxID=2012487 RepID=A0A532V6A3_UNCT6|nr:MAG: hypothetical protein CEE36_06465 [candidate division TA06 bacterium B3_TA06]
MKIMVRSKGEKGWKPLDESHYDSEAHLQELLNKDISLIPLEPPLLVSVSEFGLPGSGATDIIAVNQDGAITIIECKLAKSHEVRRMVIGQLLEYAAFLTKMSADEFVETFDRLADAPLYETIASKLEDFEESMFKENLADNLKRGEFTLIVAVDSINEELREIILYLNAHSDCTVGALELEYFKDDKRELLVPRLYGGPEVKEATGKQRPTAKRRRWDEASFFEEARSLGENLFPLARNLYEFSKKEADIVSWGTGAVNGSFTFKVRSASRTPSIFSLFTNGFLYINFGYLSPVAKENDMEILRNKLNEIPGVSIEAKNFSEYYPTFKFELLRDESALRIFKEAVLWMRDVLHSYKDKQ